MSDERKVICEKAKSGECRIFCSGAVPHFPQMLLTGKLDTELHHCHHLWKRGDKSDMTKCVPVSGEEKGK